MSPATRVRAGGGLVLESYAPNQKLNWRLMGLTFVDLADADPADTRAIYSKEARFGLGANGAWTYEATTLDRFSISRRSALAHLVGRRVGAARGRPEIFVRARNVCRAIAGLSLRAKLGNRHPVRAVCAPSTSATKASGPRINRRAARGFGRDLNGNGAFDEGEYQSQPDAAEFDGQAWWVDARGDVWISTERGEIRRFRANLTGEGALSYDFAASDSYPHPREFELVRRLRYDVARDIMVIGGTNATDKNQHWKPMGPVLARYDGWSAAQAEQTPPAKWTTTLFYVPGSQGHESCEPMSFDIAGDLIYVPYTGASQEANMANGHVKIYRLSDAGLVGAMEPGPQVGEIGLQDIPESLRAVQTGDGETLVFVEDDAKAKILVYRVRPN